MDEDKLREKIRQIIGIRVNVVGRPDLGLEPYSTYAADNRQVDALVELVKGEARDARTDELEKLRGAFEMLPILIKGSKFEQFKTELINLINNRIANIAVMGWANNTGEKK